MKERPILFSAPMVRAILAGQKTQTRRVVKPQPVVDCALSNIEATDLWTYTFCEEEWKCPYGAPGDRLWVRETFYIDRTPADDGTGEWCGWEEDIYWRATDEVDPSLDCSLVKWKPSIFMPRWASRITLEIADINVERLVDISEQDIQAEGLPLVESGPFKGHFKTNEGYQSPFLAFESLWDSINGKKYPWISNPWVWAISFK